MEFFTAQQEKEELVIRHMMAEGLSNVDITSVSKSVSSGGKRASFGVVVRQEEGQLWDALPVRHTHHLCGKPPRDSPGDMGELS